ncbi:SpaH/EbpB family LPXTG-anchored major pilin [Corynebacterium breve]|uniref:SpaH/EbpB family LPXTG-anchored major pilin n=1 Tax=Corynebacterium breve TaxID=3049799 RepID=A0ABY8VBP4_9CORY|nr:SpaH/EbpB family LPXTG-anchored major pilin [Corynebacterium breve]WIM66898.1 SpaH/EbpB family LPXTG-anchored major pilin [Corynebacterium breve]
MATISFKRTAAFVAAFGIALAPATAGIALAQTVTNVPVDLGGIDANASGTLTVVKKKLASDETPGEIASGETMEGTPGTLLPGVTFTVQPVTGVDLSTNAGWEAASKIANGSPTDPDLALGAATSATTNEQGEAKFTDLPVGLYLVTETEVPEGVVPSGPFFVFLPMTSAASDATSETTWNYNPIVYPKNTESNVTKEVQDADQNVGDSITYTITSDIPALAGDTTISKYEVYDDLDEEQLTTTADQITVGLTDGTTFVQGTDYTVAVDPVTQAVSIEFTEQGRIALTDAKKADAAVQVVTTIEAAVGEIGTTDGVVVNEAKTVTNNGGGGGDTTTPSNEVKTTWGKLIVNKTNEDGEKLEGATFELYRCSAGGVLEDSNTETPEIDPLTVNGETAWTTDAEGAITVDGLHVTDIENNDDAIEKNYCLVETQAPAGYAKLVDPIPFQLTGEANVTYTADVLNVDDDDFLPSTGGMGVGLIIAVGAGLIGAGAYAARRNSQTA